MPRVVSTVSLVAKLAIEGSSLVVRLSALEKLGALSGDVEVPLARVVGARVTDRPYAELRGLRVGTGVPFVIVLGRMIYGSGKDFVAVYGTGRTVIVELAEGSPYRRIFVSTDDATIADEIQARVVRAA
jgi:hypothetical protein